jgi:hypothetical protein
LYIVFVRNLKRKSILLGTLVFFWIAMFFLSSFIINKNLIFNITLDNSITFSYPCKYVISNIFTNKQLGKVDVETNSSFATPLTEQFSNFDSVEGEFSFNYPSSFTLSQKFFAGSDIIYHIDFHNSTDTAHGFVQVWNLPYSLKDFLDKSKAVSQQNFKYFNSKPITVNGLPGYLWDYSVLGNDMKYYKGSEVFLQKGNKMYRLSYFVTENLWNKDENNIFWKMVNSLKIR